MIPRRRVLLFVALALCIPLPAFALNSDQPAPAPLSVRAALDRCALLTGQVHCRFDLAFDSVEAATSYRAAVARPDGSVLELGEIGPSPASVWVPYAGNGTYSLEVSAYGEAEKPDQPKLLGRDRAEVDEDQEGEALDEVEEVEDEKGGESSEEAKQPASGEPASGQPEPEADLEPTAEEPGPDEDQPQTGPGAGNGPGAGDDHGGESPAPACAPASDVPEETATEDAQEGREAAEPDTINSCPR